MKAETREELKVRLHQEGRWKQYLARREQLKATGVPAGEAWRQAAQEFPALAGTEPDGLSTRPDPVSAVVPMPAAVSGAAEAPRPAKNRGGRPRKSPFAGKQPDIRRDVAWVADKLSDPTVRIQDAPSGTAWNLLTWARQDDDHQTMFWRSHFARLVGDRGKTEAAERPAQTDDPPDASERATSRLLASLRGEDEERPAVTIDRNGKLLALLRDAAEGAVR